ncbi:MAG: hypothetical protein QGI45_09645 [Myxococcota bacterium]|nr:hypothetical protein [Myxococcota bacterium]
MKYENSMNRFGFACMTLAIAAALSLAACGAEEEQGVPKVKNNGDLNTQSTGDNNNNTQEEEKSDCVVICEKQISCMGNLSCQPGAVGTVEQCAAQCEQSPPTQDQVNSYEAASCDQINASVCTDANAQQACDCSAYASQGGGSCAEGQTCFPTQQTGLNVCATSSGTFPADAATCDASTTCAEGYTCMIESAGDTAGSCLQNC